MELHAALKSQYKASLAMLRQAIESCPTSLWTDSSYVNPFWQVAYHALFYTDFYLQPSEAAFVPWEHHRPGYNRFNPDPVAPYSADEILVYCARCENMVDSSVDRLDLSAAESGFPWYKMSKLEHQLVNVRHLQHHTAQLAERIRQATGQGVRWVRGVPQ
jgi:DinB family protein